MDGKMGEEGTWTGRMKEGRHASEPASPGIQALPDMSASEQASRGMQVTADTPASEQASTGIQAIADNDD